LLLRGNCNSARIGLTGNDCLQLALRTLVSKTNAPITLSTGHERIIVLLLCAIAAVRVFTFAAAFPFFNNVDEQAHVDLVMKYAHCDSPRDLGYFSAEAAYYFSLYVTPEYFETVGVPILAGRNFDGRDTVAGPRVAIVNKTMALRYVAG